MNTTLVRKKEAAMGIEYEGEDGSRYLLAAVDRKYTGNPKAPVYYLRKWNGEEKKWEYVSGLFRTPMAAVYSLDIKDALAVRALHSIMFMDGGAVATIVAGKTRMGKKT